MTEDEIREALDARGIPYPTSGEGSLKADLLFLLTDAVAEEVNEIEERSGSPLFGDSPPESPISGSVLFCYIADHAVTNGCGHNLPPAALCSWSDRPPGRSPAGGGKWVRVEGDDIPQWALLARS